MRIRTQFTITMVLFGAVLLVILATALVIRNELELLHGQKEISLGIERGVSNLSYLSSAYLLHHESQQRARWDSEFSAISNDLSRLNPEDPEARAVVNNIKANLQRMKAVFADVASGLERTHRTQGAEIIPAVFRVSWSRMAVQNQGISFDASRLSRMLQDRTDRLTSMRTRLIFTLIGLFVAFLLTIYVLTYRRVLKSISDLQTGTRIIGAGNFDYALSTRHDDEVGELSHAFNRMTASLREATASRAVFEKEVAERKQAEDLARDRLAEIEDLYRNAPVGLCALDRELRFLRVNERLAEINGISAAAHLGKTVRELMPELANAVEPEMRHVLETGEPRLDIEIVSETPAQPGVKRSWMEQWLPIRDAQGHVTGLSIVVEETTERKRAEQEIRSLARFPAENPNPVLRLDSGGRILFANQASAALLHHWGKAVGDQAAAPWPAIVRDALTNGSGTTLEVGCGDLTYAVFVAPVREAGYVNLYSSDISARKRMEEMLREGQERLRLVLQAAKAGTWSWDVATGAMDWSDEYHDLLGLEPGAGAPSYAAWMAHVHPEDRTRVADDMHRMLREGQDFELEFRILRADGTDRWVSRRGRFLSGPGGLPVRAIGITFDITDVKGAELALRAALATMEARLDERSGQPTMAPSDELGGPLPSEIGVLGRDVGRRAAELVALDRIAEVLASSLDLSATLPRLLPEIRCLFDAEAAGVMLLDAVQEALTIVATDGEALLPLRGLRLPLEGTLTGQVVQTRQAIQVDDAANDPRIPASSRALTGGRIRSMLLVPLVCKEQVLGLLGLVNRSAGPFLPHHLRTLSLIANTAAFAIDNARLFEEAQKSRARLEQVSHWLVEAQEAERRAIARELHDEIGQALTGLKLILAPGPAGLATLQVDRRAEAQALLTDLLGRVRDLSLDLRPAVLDDLGLLAAILWHTERFSRLTGVQVRVQHTGLQGQRFPTAMEIAVFRVVQEALTNVARHAAVQEATVRLWADADVLGANVEDQGLGFDAEAMLSAHRSTGLSAMQERARLLGGRSSVESRPGSGARITVEFPLTDAAPSAEGEP